MIVNSLAVSAWLLTCAIAVPAFADSAGMVDQDGSEVLAPPPPDPNNDDPACGAVVCLFGEFIKQPGGGDCPDYEKKYFSIRDFKDGSFSPSRTAASRLQYLNKCTTSVPGTREAINGVYGPMFDGP